MSSAKGALLRVLVFDRKFGRGALTVAVALDPALITPAELAHALYIDCSLPPQP